MKLVAWFLVAEFLVYLGPRLLGDGNGATLEARLRRVNRPAKERFAVFREANGRVRVFKDRAVRR